MQKSGKEVALESAPQMIEKYKEIAIQYNSDVVSLYNSLTPEERVFVYYLFRASLPGNRIFADQIHRHALEVIKLFETVVDHQDTLIQHEHDQYLKTFDVKKFIDQAKTFLVYLWTNHGQYFQREHANAKRTPERLGLGLLTQKNLIAALKSISFPDAEKTVLHLTPTIFDKTIEPTICVPNSIKDSAVNVYAPNFTEQDYATLSIQTQNKLNAYFHVDESEGKREPKMVPYAIGAKYDQELSTSLTWLKRACGHAQKFPKIFDTHLVESLKLLILFVQTGDEKYFKQHSIEWLKSSSRIDYNFGFIETYDDPKSRRGFFQAEVTIKSVDINKLNKILPEIEKQLPVPDAFKRETSNAIPNASINNKIFGMGALGPMFITAAYCLPNYPEIRSEHGSKQIIYPAFKGLCEIINPELNRNLFSCKKLAEWQLKHDLDGKLGRDIWDVHCILHETIGHGSGRLAQHTFKEGDYIVVNGQEHTLGDTIPVTSDNINELLAGYENTIEELRAEIIALYVSINHLDKLLACDLLKGWDKVMSHDELKEHLILAMARTGLRRYMQQSDGATEISGDHARANCALMYFLLEHGGIELVEETVEVHGKQHTVIDLVLADAQKAQEAIKELMVQVQRIKSTGDRIGAQGLIDTYGTKLRHPHFLTVLKENREAIVGKLKCQAFVFPNFIP
ncbi:MAG: hypothetical protein V1855_05220, partial [bacterium]